MDLNKLRTQVFEKTGIRIETNDPVFALVALNEAVLSEYVEQHIYALENASRQLHEQTAQLLEVSDRTEKLLLQMGLATGLPPAASRPSGIEKIDAFPASDRNFTLSWRWMGITCATSVLSSLLVLSGQAGFGYSRAPTPTTTTLTIPATTASMSALTPEQLALIQNGEKYAKMWSKLDAKTQERIQALSQ